MARKKIKAREDKKTDANSMDDEFIQKTTSVFDWSYQHRRPLVMVAVIALLVAVGGIAIDHFSSKSLAQESMLLSKGLEAIVAPVIPSKGDDVIPPKEDERLTFDSLKARATESLKAIGEVPSGVGGGVEVAKLFVEAASHFDLGEYDQAIASYEALVGRTQKEIEFLRPSVLEGLGLSLEAAGRNDDAKKRFDELSKLQGVSGELGKYHLGRIEEEGGNVEQAKKLYKEVVDAFAERGNKSSRDYLFVNARERLLALDPTAEVPAPASSGLNFDDMDPELLKQILQMQQQGGGGLN